MISRGVGIGRTPLCLINKLADITEYDEKNLLHLAAAVASQYGTEKEDHTFYFKMLLELKFPLYNEDDN